MVIWVFDSDGSISMNLNTKVFSIFFSISQKYKDSMEILPTIYGGKIFNHDKAKIALEG